MGFKRFAVGLVVCALAGTASVRAADVEKKSEKSEKSAKPGPLPRAAAKHDAHKRVPAPTSGSMPKGEAPRGKLGTEPTARGKLGTDPKPGESSKPPPRFN